MTDAVQAWLAQLDEATRSRWQVAPTAATGSTPSLRLLRNGRLQATVRMEGSAVRVEAAGGSSTAATGGATAAALRSALEQAAP